MWLLDAHTKEELGKGTLTIGSELTLKQLSVQLWHIKIEISVFGGIWHSPGYSWVAEV